MSVTEHLEELIQRILFSLIVFTVVFIITFSNIKKIVNLLQIPAQGVRFLLRHGLFIYYIKNVNLLK